MNIIDFHTHAFPDAVAEVAIPKLSVDGITPHLDGKIASLLKSMDQAGVERSMVCSIATKPDQFGPILKWSKAIASERLIPFPSVHPGDPEAAERIARIKAEGFLGVKMHPYYQSFVVDEERMFPFYEAVQAAGLILLVHAGFDIAFPRDRVCDPIRFAHVAERFPALKIVVAHMGAWDDWEETRKHLLGKPVYVDLSFFLNSVPEEIGREFLLAHPADKLLFGTDSPWTDQRREIQRVLDLGLDEKLTRAILYENARALLDSVN